MSHKFTFGTRTPSLVYLPPLPAGVSDPETSSFGPPVFCVGESQSVGIYCLCLTSHPYKQKGGLQRGGEGEEGRVAAFRTTDTERGFIPSSKDPA